MTMVMSTDGGKDFVSVLNALLFGLGRAVSEGRVIASQYKKEIDAMLIRNWKLSNWAERQLHLIWVEWAIRNWMSLKVVF